MECLPCFCGNDDEPSDKRQKSDIKKATRFIDKFVGHVVHLSLIIHVLALIGAGAAKGLNVGSYYGLNQGEAPMGFSDSNFVKLLLLPAKILDTFPVASVSTVVLHHVIGHIQKKAGLPLGLLGSAYQTHSLKFLFHKGFWHSFWHHKCLSLGLMLAAVFTALVGWSSTIVLTPNLAWWSVNDHQVYNSTLSPYLNVDKSRMYPAKLSAPTSTDLASCDTASYSSTFPGAAFSSLQDWTTSWANRGGIPRLTMTEDVSQGRRSVTLSQTKATSNVAFGAFTGSITDLSATISTGSTLPHAVTELTALFWSYLSDDLTSVISQTPRARLTGDGTASNDTIAMPLVQFQCAVYDYMQARESAAIYFPTDVLDAAWQPFANSSLSNGTATSTNSTSSNTTMRWPVDPSLWKLQRPLGLTNFTWVDISNLQNSSTSGQPNQPLYLNLSNQLLVLLVVLHHHLLSLLVYLLLCHHHLLSLPLPILYLPSPLL